MNKVEIKNVLLVCTGNSCRSAMAEGYLRVRIDELKREIYVHSAGTATVDGMPASGEAVAVTEKIGLDISRHRTTQLTRELIAAADIVLVMEEHHKSFVSGILSGAGDKVRFFREFDGRTADIIIPDPIGSGIGFYENVFDIIKESSEGFIKWLKEKE